jgi:predicted TIM-barrel fold metal-dependent hydrolase
MIFDSDNHYYEQEDAFTRYVPHSMHDRCVKWIEIDGKKRVLIGGRLNNYIKDPAFQFVPKPGSIYEYTTGYNPEQHSMKKIIGSSMMHKDNAKFGFYFEDKIKQMKSMSIDKAIIYSTYGLIIENYLYHDEEALYCTLNGFNKWIVEEWGQDRQKIEPAPVVSLVNADYAVQQLKFLIENNIKIINISPNFIPTSNGGVSPTSKIYDNFWKIINDNKIVIGLHENDSWNIRMSKNWGNKDLSSFNLDNERFSTLVSTNSFHDFFAKIIIDNFFEKFPKIKFITSESGSDWVYLLFKKLTKAYNQNNSLFFKNPIETFKENIFVSPFPHDDIYMLEETLGYKNIILSTDFPHVEGSCDPDIFIKNISKMQNEKINDIIYNNINNLIS